MFEIEFIDHVSGNIIRTKAKSEKQKRSVVKAIEKLKGRCIVVRETDYQETFNVWLYSEDEQKFVMVQAKPIDRRRAGVFWADWKHQKEGSVAVIWPNDVPMNLRIKDS